LIYVLCDPFREHAAFPPDVAASVNASDRLRETARTSIRMALNAAKSQGRDDAAFLYQDLSPFLTLACVPSEIAYESVSGSDFRRWLG
jgi:hypothetical protein